MTTGLFDKFEEHKLNVSPTINRQEKTGHLVLSSFSLEALYFLSAALILFCHPLSPLPSLPSYTQTDSNSVLERDTAPPAYSLPGPTIPNAQRTQDDLTCSCTQKYPKAVSNFTTNLIADQKVSGCRTQIYRTSVSNDSGKRGDQRLHQI